MSPFKKMIGQVFLLLFTWFFYWYLGEWHLKKDSMYFNIACCWFIYNLLSFQMRCMYEGGADKSLTWSGRKQATETKHGIYSTYSPQSSIHFLAHCCNFCKWLKKNSEGCPSNQVSAAAITSASDEKWRPFDCFFSVQGTGGQIQRIGWVNNTLEAQVVQLLLGCKCPVSRGIVQEQDPLDDLSTAISFKMSFICTSRDE